MRMRASFGAALCAAALVMGLTAPSATAADATASPRHTPTVQKVDNAVPLADAARDAKSDRAAAAAASHVVNQGSNKCLAVPGGSTAKGTGLIQWPCGTWRDHYWTAEPWSINGAVYYRFVNANSGQCLAVPGGSTKAGTQVIQWPCGTWADHFWGVTTDGKGLHLFNYYSGQCLGVEGGSLADGAKAIQWGCGTWADHYWWF